MAISQRATQPGALIHKLQMMRPNLINVYISPETTVQKPLLLLAGKIRGKRSNKQIQDEIIYNTHPKHLELMHECEEETKLTHTHWLLENPLTLEELSFLLVQLGAYEFFPVEDCDAFFKQAQAILKSEVACPLSDTASVMKSLASAKPSQKGITESKKTEPETLPSSTASSKKAMFSGLQGGFLNRKTKPKTEPTPAPATAVAVASSSASSVPSLSGSAS